MFIFSDFRSTGGRGQNFFQLIAGRHYNNVTATAQLVTGTVALLIEMCG